MPKPGRFMRTRRLLPFERAGIGAPAELEGAAG